MTKFKEFVGPNTKIILGIVYFLLAIIYIADRLMGDLDIRLFDWIGWIAMFTAGAISIIEGVRIKKNNSL
jgi:hypothetical protein